MRRKILGLLAAVSLLAAVTTPMAAAAPPRSYPGHPEIDDNNPPPGCVYVTRTLIRCLSTPADRA